MFDQRTPEERRLVKLMLRRAERRQAPITVLKIWFGLLGFMLLCGVISSCCAVVTGPHLSQAEQREQTKRNTEMIWGKHK